MRMEPLLFLAALACITPTAKPNALASSDYWGQGRGRASRILGAHVAVEEDAGDGGSPAAEEDPGTNIAFKNPETVQSRSGSGLASDFNSNTGTVSGNNFKPSSINTASTRANECQGRGTVCVPYYQCDQGFVITDGKGLIDIRVGEDLITPHSNCERYLDVCCSHPNPAIVEPPITDNHQPGCGRRNAEGVHASITGFNVTQTQFGEYPWMVAILRIETIGGQDVNLYLCGGSLIQPNVVLTAAHCVNEYGVKTLKIRAGEWDTQSEYELYPHQDKLVKHAIIHPDFNPGSLWNDFAILILDSPLVLAPNVDTICLPDLHESFDHVTCYATGWGKDKFGKEGRFQNILKQVALDIIPHNVCQNALRSTRLGEHFKLDHSFMCAGGKRGVDTCKGDGGSPLVCARPTNGFQQPSYFQAGIVAWGIGCGENGIPGVYADVTAGVDWIYQTFTPYLI